MKKILSIQSSINGAQSVSKQLSEEIIEHLLSSHAGSIVTERDLSATQVPHLEGINFLAARTPEPQRTDIQVEAAAYGNELITELLLSDIIVIGVPFYNFNIPSTLKSWLDHIAVPGKTFSYENGVPEGLVKNKKVFLAIAVGGIYDSDMLKHIDNTEPYMRSVLGFLGMTDVTVFKANGLSMPDVREQHLQQTRAAINEFAY